MVVYVYIDGGGGRCQSIHAHSSSPLCLLSVSPLHVLQLFPHLQTPLGAVAEPVMRGKTGNPQPLCYQPVDLGIESLTQTWAPVTYLHLLGNPGGSTGLCDTPGNREAGEAGRHKFWVSVAHRSGGCPLHPAIVDSIVGPRTKYVPLGGVVWGFSYKNHTRQS